MKLIFYGYHLTSQNTIPSIIDRFANNKMKIRMARKLQFLVMINNNDPYFELLGYIRDQNSIGKN